jgi:predicted permease
MLHSAPQDLTFAVRSLLRRPAISLLAIASLAIGIAANATVFSLVQAVEFPRLIYPDASRLVFLESRHEGRGLVGMPVSAPDALDVASASRTLRQASLAADQSSVLRDGASTRRIAGRRVEPTFFDVLRVAPALGRTLTAGDLPGVAVLGDGLWRAAFSADPAIVGRPVRLDGGVVTIVGIMPPRFDADADFWVPLSTAPAAAPRDDRQYTLFARLADGASIEDATRELAGISRRLAAGHPATNDGWVTFPTLVARMHGRDSRGTFILLQAAVAVVLLVACANIANLLLARGTERRREIAVRVALGAGRARVAAALLAESLILSCAGGALGVLLAMWGIRLARITGGFPDAIDPTLNTGVLGFLAAVSMLTGLICGVVPALTSSNIAPDAILRAESDRVTGGPRRGGLGSGLVIAQVACALVLTTAGTLMIRTLVNRQRVDVGFDPRGALRAELVLAGDRYQDQDVARAAVRSLLDELAASEGIRAAGAVTWALPTGAGGQRPLTLPAVRDAALDPAIRRGVEAVTPGYFDALGVALTAGRSFTAADGAGAAAVAMVNEELARRLWPGRSPIGEPLRLGAPGDRAPVVTVVGVVGTIRRSAMHDVVVARVYVPYAQHPNAMLSLVVRSRGGAADAARALASAVGRVDPNLFAEGVQTLEADLAQFVAPLRMITWLLTGFGAAGLLLAGLGVYGTMSYAVAQRQREMAIRSALGANGRDLAGIVFARAAWMTSLGVGAGIAIALATTRALAGFLFGVSPTDPRTLLLAAGFLAFVATAACVRPALAAARLDPITLLRA